VKVGALSVGIRGNPQGVRGRRRKITEDLLVVHTVVSDLVVTATDTTSAKTDGLKGRLFVVGVHRPVDLSSGGTTLEFVAETNSFVGCRGFVQVHVDAGQHVVVVNVWEHTTTAAALSSKAAGTAHATHAAAVTAVRVGAGATVIVAVTSTVGRGRRGTAGHSTGHARSRRASGAADTESNTAWCAECDTAASTTFVSTNPEDVAALRKIAVHTCTVRDGGAFFEVSVAHGVSSSFDVGSVEDNTFAADGVEEFSGERHVGAELVGEGDTRVISTVDANTCDGGVWNFDDNWSWGHEADARSVRRGVGGDPQVVGPSCGEGNVHVDAVRPRVSLGLLSKDQSGSSSANVCRSVESESVSGGKCIEQLSVSSGSTVGEAGGTVLVVEGEAVFRHIRNTNRNAVHGCPDEWKFLGHLQVGAIAIGVNSNVQSVGGSRVRVALDKSVVAKVIVLVEVSVTSGRRSSHDILRTEVTASLNCVVDFSSVLVVGKLIGESKSTVHGLNADRDRSRFFRARFLASQTSMPVAIISTSVLCASTFVTVSTSCSDNASVVG